MIQQTSSHSKRSKVYERHKTLNINESNRQVRQKCSWTFVKVNIADERIRCDISNNKERERHVVLVIIIIKKIFWFPSSTSIQMILMIFCAVIAPLSSAGHFWKFWNGSLNFFFLIGKPVISLLESYSTWHRKWSLPHSVQPNEVKSVECWVWSRGHGNAQIPNYIYTKHFTSFQGWTPRKWKFYWKKQSTGL